MKTSALVALLFAGNVAKGLAEEVVGEIMFEPERVTTNLYEVYFEYYLDTTGDLIVDRRMSLSERNGEAVYKTLSMYLKSGWKIVFEDKNLKPFEDFSARCMVAMISPDGKYIDLSQMFPLDIIKSRLPYLYEKLVREGRAK